MQGHCGNDNWSVTLQVDSQSRADLTRMPIASDGPADKAHQLAFVFHTVIFICLHLQMGIVQSSLPDLSHLLLLYSIVNRENSWPLSLIHI